MKELGDSTRQQLGWYVHNCVNSAVAGRLERILLERLKSLKGAANDEDDRDLSTVKSRRQQMRELRRILRDYSISPTSNESLEQNVLFARDEFGLDEIDSEILLLLLRYDRSSELESFFDEVTRHLNSVSRALATLIGIEPSEAHRRIIPEGALLSSGILTINEVGSYIGGHCGFLRIAPPLSKVMFRPYRSREEWSAAIFGPPLTPDLSWTDFDHVGVGRDLAARVLAGAGKRHANGINFLIHGPVGTGKTEFCKTLAAKAGMAIWSVGEADDSGGEPTRGERLVSLRLAQRLLAKRSNAMILFDEAEDLLEQPGSFAGIQLRDRTGSKVHVNRMFEQNPVPVLWTCNDVKLIDPSVLRRMTLAIEIKTPNQQVRASIWRRVLAKTSLELDGQSVQRLSSRYEAPPAVAVNAVRAAALAGGGECEIEQAMDGVLQILRIGARAHGADTSDFDPGLVNCCEDLKALVERLARPNAPRNWSLCLHGMPGTGKSQFARHLAGRIGLEVMQLRASDLLSKWVGESEKKIARAFATARAERAMLIIDEADSLLADRREAVRSWEVTQVNEMLTWMENHPLPFVCTTNLMDRLDQASLRRFTLKLRFDQLDPAQAARAFEHFFGAVAPRSLPEGLAPGDFATVQRKRELFGAATPTRLSQWLDEEVQAKGLRTTSIGFIAPRHSTSGSAS